MKSHSGQHGILLPASLKNYAAECELTPPAAHTDCFFLLKPANWAVPLPKPQQKTTWQNGVKSTRVEFDAGSDERNEGLEDLKK